MTMRENLEFLKKDRKVNDAFLRKLESVGFEIEYGKFSYWSGQEYITVGRQRIWLVKEDHSGNNNLDCVWRYQNDVVRDIQEAIKEERALAETGDQIVEEFFESFDKEKKEKTELEKAVDLLHPLLNGMAEGRNESVEVVADENEYGEKMITVVIDGYDYPVNVTSENVRSMVKSVVDKVAFKLQGKESSCIELSG